MQYSSRLALAKIIFFINSIGCNQASNVLNNPSLNSFLVTRAVPATSVAIEPKVTANLKNTDPPTVEVVAAMTGNGLRSAKIMIGGRRCNILSNETIFINIDGFLFSTSPEGTEK